MAIKVQLDVMLKERGWPVSRLAQESGVTTANVWRLTRNKTRQVRTATLDAICKALNCQPGDFLIYEKDQLDLPLLPPAAESDKPDNVPVA